MCKSPERVAACWIAQQCTFPAKVKLVTVVTEPSAAMDERGDLPFKAEYAKSGRAACKRCKDTIAKDSLRLAIMVQVCIYMLVY